MRRARLSFESIPEWAKAHGVKLNGVSISKSESGYGWGVVATTVSTEPRHQFIVVPPELIINIDLIWRCSGTDPHLREILEANGDFAKVHYSPSLVLECSNRRCG